MKGDFSRITYDERKQYSLLLMQQGRVQLDADLNEQAMIQWLNLQNLAEDLIGEHGGPGESFQIVEAEVDGSAVTHDFTIKSGRYYVRGAMCQNSDKQLFFTQQEDYFPDENEKIAHDKTYLVYLHLWWRHMTADEDDDMREVALAGPDTATRLKTVWQVRLLELPAAAARNDSTQDLRQDYEGFIRLLKEKELTKPGTGVLQAQAKKASESGDPCITAPESRYRGVENQLYRVEIHRSGDGSGGATFKWSRENGSVVFPIKGALDGNSVTLEHLGRDQRFGLKVGDWVEVVDDIYELQRKAENLLKVIEVDPDTLKVTLSATPSMGRDLSVYPLKKPLLRRWDHSARTASGAISIVQDEWIELEDGVEIKFPKFQPANGEEGEYWYQSGDWWWIPARTVTGDVEWPQGVDGPAAQKALSHGDRYAPLALIESNSSGVVAVPTDYRRVIKPQWQ